MGNVAEKRHSADGTSRLYFSKAGSVVVISHPGCAVALLRRIAGTSFCRRRTNKIKISKIRKVHACVGKKAVVPGQARIHFNEVISAIFLAIFELQRSQTAISQS